MTWVKLDDGFTEHPKVLGLSDAAFRLYLHALCYAARNLTDGLIPAALVKGAGRRTVDQLVNARLWMQGAEGYAIHDYLDYQFSREQVQAHRDELSLARSVSGKRGAAKRWQTDGKPDGKDDGKPIANLQNADGKPDGKRMAPFRSRIDPKDQEVPDPTSTTPSVAFQSLSTQTTQPRVFDRSHANHVNGFCAFKCLSDEKIQTFAKDLPGGSNDADNFARVLAWAKHLRDTWGDQPKLEFEWYKFWEARWKERPGVPSASQVALQRLVARVQERLS